MERVPEPDSVENVAHRLRHGVHCLLHRLGAVVERLREIGELLGEAEIRHGGSRPRPPAAGNAYARDMLLALMIEGQEGVTWEDWCALADACEEHGVDTLFRSDHYISQGDEARNVAHDAWTTISALAARTTRLRFGTLVSPATFRAPGLLANAAATVDHVSGGRIELGMGAGWMEREHRAYGFPFPETRVRAEMRAYQHAGCDRVMLQHLLHTDLEPVRLIGRELAPALA